MSNEINELKQKYKDIYDKPPRGCKANNIEWLEKKILEGSTTTHSSRPERPRCQPTTGETLTNNHLKKINYEEALLLLKIIELDRPEQYKFARECVDSLIHGKNVSIKAEEKTGKRCIVEAIHLMLIIGHSSHILPENSDPTSIYVTALNRKDTKTQIKELTENYGIACIVRDHKKLVGEIVNILRDETNDGMFYIHLDECDYGTGESQSLNELYNDPYLNIPKNKNKIRYITYSATPEELEYSSLNKLEWDSLTFIPAKNYIGAEAYFNAGVHKPNKFFESNKITEHGTEIINEVIEKCDNTDLSIAERQRNVDRDTTLKNLEKIRKKKDELKRENKCDIFIFDQHVEFNWGEPEAWANLGMIKKIDKYFHASYNYIPVIIFISQICGRSTEICPFGHSKIFAWHDARKLSDKKPYNTLSQAIGRIKHYSQKGEPVNTIKLYCDIDILNITLGYELESNSFVLGQRIHTGKIKKKKFIFDGYVDNFTDLNSVCDSDWQTEQNPNENRIRDNQFTQTNNGQWKHTCIKNVLYWGSKGKSLGGGGKEQILTVLEYENKTSNRYIIREIKFKKNPNYKKKQELEFNTKPTSMYKQ